MKAKKSKTAKRSVSVAAANLRKAKKLTKRQRGRSANASTSRAKAADARARQSEAADNARTPVVRAGSKLEIIVGLLTREGGCTGAEILTATGWPTVSVPQQAKAAGLDLSKVKEGKVTRYTGTLKPAVPAE